MIPAEFCGDGELGYERSRTRFVPGAGLALDDSYRLAHLPLVAPDHPRVIAERPGAYYRMGRHARVHSLVLPVPWASLATAPAFRDLDGELRASLLAGKLAWDIRDRRRDRLHATVCGPPMPSRLDEAQRRALAAIGPVAVDLRGLFSGNVNVGRLYLSIYPERRDGENLLRRIQRVLGRRQSDLWVVGIHNFTDDLDPAEAAFLADLLERWRDRSILRFQADHLWLLEAADDLVLDSAVAETVPLVAGWGGNPRE